MRATLDHALLADAESALREANLAFARRYAGGARQPAHTLIEGAQHFAADVAPRRGAQAAAALDAHAPNAATLGTALGAAIDDAAYGLLRAKLARAPVEDYRVDFEDGYGVRADADEDGEALRVADAMASGARDGTLPAGVGVRVKPLGEETRARSVRTLDLLLTALADRGGPPPPGFVVTLPKVTVAEQARYLAAVLTTLERALGIAAPLPIEVQIEVPQAIVDAGGRSLLPRLIDAADGRLVGANLGVYDYTAGCGITAAHQGIRHPAAAFARRVLQAAFAGTRVAVSDGSTARLPVGDRAGVHAGWRAHFDDVRASLADGFYQGWDLHAAQLVSRHAAVLTFYRDGADVAGARMQALLGRAAEASLVGGVLDEPATGEGLLGFFRRAIAAGALDAARASALSGLSAAELRSPSFAHVLRAREARR